MTPLMFPHRLVDEVDASIPVQPAVRPAGSLLLIVGLPGAGKSTLVDEVSAQIPTLVVRTDYVRRFVRQDPTYTAAEMAFVYEVCLAVIIRRLARGQRVVFDASNYMAVYRQRLASHAERSGTSMAVCRVRASESATKDRLLQRVNGQVKPANESDAGWSVYAWMRRAQEPLVLPHLDLDTSKRPVTDLAAELLSYWMACEVESERNNHLQSAGRTGEPGFYS